MKQNEPDRPIKALLHGILLNGFGVFALFIAWILTKSDINWFLLVFMIASFIIPALAAFWLGMKRIHDFIKGKETPG